MALSMAAAGENEKEFIVLDRPNPIDGVDVEGPVLDSAWKSFVGMFPIPARHGLTLGELAKMIAGEHWLGVNTDLIIIPMEGWTRGMWYDETGLPWISPSPNMKTLQTAIVYPGSCLLEGTNISEGRGTARPFEVIGAPWIDGNDVAERMNAAGLAGVIFSPTKFTPTHGQKFGGHDCRGVSIDVVDRSRFNPFLAGVTLLSLFQERYPDSLVIKADAFDRLAGTDKLRKGLLDGKRPADLTKAFSPEIQAFKAMRKKYLLYK
jgi:uncharacterized protein YbbC (DUF1343 family)